MMAQVSRCSEEWRLAIFITAVSRDRLQFCQSATNFGQTPIIKRELEQPQVVLYMFALSKPRADDNSPDHGLFKNIAASHISHRYTLSFGGTIDDR